MSIGIEKNNGNVSAIIKVNPLRFTSEILLLVCLLAFVIIGFKSTEVKSAPIIKTQTVAADRHMYKDIESYEEMMKFVSTNKSYCATRK